MAAPVPRDAGLLSAPQSEALFAALRGRLGLLGGDAPAAAAAALDRLEELCRDRRRLAEQERLHRWLHSWLLLHVPLSAALLVLSAAHVVTALYY